MFVGDSLGLTAADEYNLAVRALGSVTWYVKFIPSSIQVLKLKVLWVILNHEAKNDQ